MSQGKYTVDILHRFGMMDCKSMSNLMVSNLRKLLKYDIGLDPMGPTLYKSFIGSSMYLIHLRPNICYTVNISSEFMSDSKHIH